MGSPMVFQTAPPQPASKARIICSPQLVGGADASQNGLRHSMPQKVLASVGLDFDMLHPQPSSDSDSSALPIRHRVHDLAPAVRTISPSKKLRLRGLSCR